VLASLLGAIVHGLDLSPRTQAWLWRPLYLLLGLVVAMFVIGAIFDFKGQRTASAWLVPMLVIACVFFALTQVGSGGFSIFIAYEAAAMLAALGMYLTLSIRGALAGAGTIAAGITLNMAAAAIQAADTISVTIVVPFDHNGVFHLVQIAALLVLAFGLTRSMS
jgi:hypothetical protein